MMRHERKISSTDTSLLLFVAFMLLAFSTASTLEHSESAVFIARVPIFPFNPFCWTYPEASESAILSVEFGEIAWIKEYMLYLKEKHREMLGGGWKCTIVDLGCCSLAEAII